MADKTKLIAELRKRLENITPLPDEPDFFTSEETLVRFLKSRDWNLEDAERMLKASIEYRRKTRPQFLNCSWCHNRPGFHSMRQVGNDEAGRPVIYSSFVQAATHKNSADDSVAHVTYLIENAKRTMRQGVSTWVFVLDCTGMTLGSCNPKLGYGMATVLADHYPERLGLVIGVNHSAVFHGVWKAMKQFVHPQTAAKVKLVRSKSKMVDLFSQLFSPELSSWLQEEIAINRQKPLPKSQVEFWNPPSSLDDSKLSHDPRGCPSYISQRLEAFRKVSHQQPPRFDGDVDGPGSGTATPLEDVSLPLSLHKPHPNIVEQLTGHKVASVALSKEELQERLQAQSVAETESAKEESVASSVDGEGSNYELDIPSDLQIPTSAVPLSATS